MAEIAILRKGGIRQKDIYRKYFISFKVKGFSSWSQFEEGDNLCPAFRINTLKKSLGLSDVLVIHRKQKEKERNF